jgi:hypothetical protein
MRPARVNDLLPAGASAVEKLESLGVHGILRQLARDGQIVDNVLTRPDKPTPHLRPVS